MQLFSSLDPCARVSYLGLLLWGTLAALGVEKMLCFSVEQNVVKARLKGRTWF